MNTTAPDHISATRDQLLTLLTDYQIIATRLAPQDYNTALVELGVMDSMGMVQALGIIDEAFGIDIPLAMLATELTSINAIAGYITMQILPEVA